MKNLNYIVLLMFLSCLPMVVGCTSASDEFGQTSCVVANQENTNVNALHGSQLTFISAMDSIGSKYTSANTRSAAYEFASWGLNAIADGIGSCIGSGVASWFTGAAASWVYAKYIKHCQQIVSKDEITNSGQIPDSMRFKQYINSNDSIKFIFCDGFPTNSIDSIGYSHNYLLGKLSEELPEITDRVNYNDIRKVMRRRLPELGHNKEEIAAYDTKEYYDFCYQLAKILSEVQNNNKSINEQFAKIEVLLKSQNNENPKYTSELIKHFTSVLSSGISSDNLYNYSSDLNKALKASYLNKDDRRLTKSFLQTTVSSLTYWRYQK